MENNELLRVHADTIPICEERRFAACLRRLRLAIHSKQASFSEAVGCTEAAVSLWESGARFPTPRSFSRLLTALAEEGVLTSELLELRGFWLNEYVRRRAARRG
jgi:transcriptional regulator with XRE-family HTH domain